MNIAIIGRSRMLYNTAVRLRDEGHSIKAIITAKTQPEYTKNESDFKKLAEKMKIPFFLARSFSEPRLMSALKGLDLGVSVNWVSVVSQDVIDSFRIGILNAHMGDLPSYRGNACPNWAIINGEDEIVLSAHLMEGGKLDSGRIITQEKMPLLKDTYIGDVYNWSEETTPKLFLKALSSLEGNPGYTLKNADAGSPGSFRCYPRRPEDSKINWNDAGEKIYSLIRASSRPFSGAYCFLNVEKLIIWKAEIYSDNEHFCAMPGQICKVGRDYFVVITGNGKLLVREWECASKVTSIRQRLS